MTSGSLFDPITVGSLTLRNRVMRSATAERLTERETGAPRPALGALYEGLARGGVGLIVTGHAYVQPSGRAHDEMTSLADDAVIGPWRATIAPAQALGARVMVQINHAGSNCDQAATPDPVSPSGVATSDRARPRAMTAAEVEGAIRAFGQAARRAREAGFDGVQIHGAHGYLVSQFLTPATNTRDDAWGPDGPDGRLGFLKAVAEEVRRQVGDDYPVWIKLGVAGAPEHGLDAALGARAAALCREVGIDCIEISHALGQPEAVGRGEARFLPMAEATRQAVGRDYPLALVNGLRTLRAMEALLASGVVQIISLCRPLIAEPDLVKKFQAAAVRRAACVSCGECWPHEDGEGIGCHNAKVQEAVARRAPKRT